jgi:hypothetical protein
MVRIKTESITESIKSRICTSHFWGRRLETLVNGGVYIVYSEMVPMCFVFCRLYPFSPPSHHGSVWVLPVISLLYCQCWLALSYDRRGFVGSKKKTITGLLVFNPLCHTSTVHLPPPTQFLPHFNVGQLISHCPSLIILVTFRDSYNLRIGFYLPLWNNY